MPVINRFVSFSAVFRATKGKISMLERGELTLSRIVKYAVKGKAELRMTMSRYLCKNDSIHDEAIDLLTPNLKSMKYEKKLIRPSRGLHGVEDVDWRKKKAGNAQWKEGISLYEYRYPEREIVQNLLRTLSKTAAPELSLRIKMLLHGALPVSEEVEEVAFVRD